MAHIVSDEVKEFAEKALRAIQHHFDCLEPRDKIPKPKSQSDIAFLGLESRCRSISGAMLSLIPTGFCTEAQTLERSLIEASLNFLYISTGGKESGSRAFEYGEPLSLLHIEQDYRDIERMRNAAAEVIAGIREISEAQKPLVDEIGEFERTLEAFRNDAEKASNMPKSLRKDIKERWKPYAMAQDTLRNPSLKTAMIFRYMLSSRLCHGNYAGLSMIDMSFNTTGKITPSTVEISAWRVIDLTVSLLLLRLESLILHTPKFTFNSEEVEFVKDIANKKAILPLSNEVLKDKASSLNFN